MNDYNLGFISNEDIFTHVKTTVEQYKTLINLDKFNNNIIDPIKLTFDAKVYGMSFDEIIESECLRQIDKANTNHIGFFHQNLFKYVGNGWKVPEKGFDVVNENLHIYVEMKNKHNTMNSSSAQATYMKMQQKLLDDKQAKCLLVEVIAKQSQYITWKATLNGVEYNNENIKRVSIDQFYNLVFDDSEAFMKLCKKLPIILDDVLAECGTDVIENTVKEELKEISTDSLKSLYLLAFNTYEGFSNF